MDKSASGEPAAKRPRLDLAKPPMSDDLSSMSESPPPPSPHPAEEIPDPAAKPADCAEPADCGEPVPPTLDLACQDLLVHVAAGTLVRVEAVMTVDDEIVPEWITVVVAGMSTLAPDALVNHEDMGMVYNDPGWWRLFTRLVGAGSGPHRVYPLQPSTHLHSPTSRIPIPPPPKSLTLQPADVPHTRCVIQGPIHTAAEWRPPTHRVVFDWLSLTVDVIVSHQAPPKNRVFEVINATLYRTAKATSVTVYDKIMKELSEPRSCQLETGQLVMAIGLLIRWKPQTVLLSTWETVPTETVVAVMVVWLLLQAPHVACYTMAMALLRYGSAQSARRINQLLAMGLVAQHCSLNVATPGLVELCVVTVRETLESCTYRPAMSSDWAPADCVAPSLLPDNVWGLTALLTQACLHQKITTASPTNTIPERLERVALSTVLNLRCPQNTLISLCPVYDATTLKTVVERHPLPYSRHLPPDEVLGAVVKSVLLYDASVHQVTPFLSLYLGPQPQPQPVRHRAMPVCINIRISVRSNRIVRLLKMLDGWKKVLGLQPRRVPIDAVVNVATNIPLVRGVGRSQLTPVPNNPSKLVPEPTWTVIPGQQNYECSATVANVVQWYGAADPCHHDLVSTYMSTLRSHMSALSPIAVARVLHVLRDGHIPPALHEDHNAAYLFLSTVAGLAPSALRLDPPRWSTPCELLFEHVYQLVTEAAFNRFRAPSATVCVPWPPSTATPNKWLSGPGALAQLLRHSQVTDETMATYTASIAATFAGLHCAVVVTPQAVQPDADSVGHFVTHPESLAGYRMRQLNHVSAEQLGLLPEEHVVELAATAIVFVMGDWTAASSEEWSRLQLLVNSSVFVFVNLPPNRPIDQRQWDFWFPRLVTPLERSIVQSMTTAAAIGGPAQTGP